MPIYEIALQPVPVLPIYSRSRKKRLPSLQTRLIYIRRRARLKRVFFMRNIRTPQNKLRILFQHLSTIYSSMVACSGKGSPFAANRMWQFCRPLHVTAKACKLYAVTLKYLHTELRK